MYGLSAYAVRSGGKIEVTVSGYLANSCRSASIQAVYPSSSNDAKPDPDSAQIFVEEKDVSRSTMCLMALVPWVGHALIETDKDYKQVEIFVNEEPRLTISIDENPENFIVIALTSGTEDNRTGCSVIPASFGFPAIYTSVFGPDSKGNCESWVQVNCKSV